MCVCLPSTGGPAQPFKIQTILSFPSESVCNQCYKVFWARITVAPLIFPVQEVSISSSRQHGGQNICEMSKLENTKCLGLRLLEEVLTSWTGKVSGATVEYGQRGHDVHSPNGSTNLEFQFESIFNLKFQPKFGIQLVIPLPMEINLGECGRACLFSPSTC